ncbi:hypothetical protein ABT160_30060 [Streptomyces sp. NPDC001941]|uniref:hypothetical protein n=1 Tax=Streptomyces sp. NPDC001941 TaxID=3154659 RepID=UPI003322F4CF
MRLMGVTAAAGCALAVIAVAGCTSGGADALPQDVPPEVVASAGAAVEAEATRSPTPGTPEEDFDAVALESEFLFDGQDTGSASQAMKRYCELLGATEVAGMPPAQWLAERELVREDAEEILAYGVDRFCPSRAATLKAAVDGGYERWFTDGTYKVGAGAKQIPAGTYRTTETLRNCSWERTSKSGTTLGEQHAGSARSVQVTVRAGDGQFTTRSCGSWRPVK